MCRSMYLADANSDTLIYLNVFVCLFVSFLTKNDRMNLAVISLLCLFDQETWIIKSRKHFRSVIVIRAPMSVPTLNY